MAIGDYLRIFRRFWWIVLIAAIVGGGVGFATSFLKTPQYQSTATLFVTTQSGTSVGDAYQNNLFSQERVVSYAGLATSEQVAARALDQLKAPMSADELRSKIKATPKPQTVLLDITATDSDPALAQAYANAVADQLVNVASELETARRGGTPAAGAVLVDDANYGTPVAGLNLLYRVVLGAVGGAFVGVILALIAGAADSRLRGRERVEDVTGTPVLGTLVEDGHRPVGPLDLAGGGTAVERIRELRTNLQFAVAADGRRPHVIAVTSPSRGDGRSTTALDIAAALAETDRSVVLVDGDLMNPSLAEKLGLDEREQAHCAVKGLTTLLTGQHDASDVVINGAGHHSFALIPAGPLPSVRKQLWAAESATRVLDVLRRDFDYVVIDTPPLTACSDGALAAVLGDGAIVLARIGSTKTSELRRAVEVLQTAHAWVIGPVVTFEPGHGREISKDRKSQRKLDHSQAAPAGESTEVMPRSGAPRGEANGAEPARGAVDRPVESDRYSGVHRLASTQPNDR